MKIKFKKTNLMLILLLGVILAFSGCSSSQTTTSSSITKISSQQLKQMLEKKDFTLIDVHIPQQKHITGTDSLIPYNKLEENLDKLPKDKNAKIVIYCRSGGMSSQFVKDLEALGYTNIYDLQGGLNAWQAAGFDVDKSLTFNI